MSLEVQFLTLIWMAGCGVVLGASFDTIGVTVRRYRIGNAIRAVLDVLYWVAATLFVFRVLMKANGGEVRLFIFLGLGIGAVLYMLLVGGWYRAVVDRLLRVLEWLFFRVVRIVEVLLWRPGRGVVRSVWRLVRWASRITTRVTVSLGRNVLQWSKFLWTRLRKRQR